MSDHLKTDEMLVLNQYRKIRDQKHGDLEISVKDGKLIKLWTTDKADLSTLKEPNGSGRKTLREVPQ